MAKCKYILNISGGGVRAIIPARCLDRMQTEFKMDLAKQFDLVIGTSGGALISAYMGIRQNSETFMSMFSHENVTNSMKVSCWDKIMKEIQFEPVYAGHDKMAMIKKIVGDSTVMSDITQPHVALVTYHLQNKCARVFNSYEPEYAMYKIYDVVNASTAAVPYFPMAEIDGDGYLDGGYVANNPILIAYTEGRKLFGKDTPLRILSFGTGRNVTVVKEDRKEWGAIQWLSHGLIDIMSDAPNDLMLEQVKQVLEMEKIGNKILHVDENIRYVKLDDHDPETLHYLQQVGDQAFRANKDEMRCFFDII